MDQVTRLADAADIAGLREHRPVAVEQTRLAYELLLVEPVDPARMSRVERWAVAAFVAILHRDEAAAEHYLDGLRAAAPAVAAVVAELAEEGAATGPYGSYPPGPLSAEDIPGGELAVDAETAEVVGVRLAAALRHAHRLVLHPRDAEPGWLEQLRDAGWDRAGIVTLSQLVSYLAYQLRLVCGLRALKEA